MQGELIRVPGRAGRAKGLFALVTLWAASTSAAFGESMVCRMNSDASERYVAREVRVEWDAYGDAVIADAVIAGAGRSSVQGKIAPGNARKVVATWQVRGVKPDPMEQRFRNANLVVRLTVQRADGSALMTVNDASNRKYSYRATGICRIDS